MPSALDQGSRLRVSAARRLARALCVAAAVFLALPDPAGCQEAGSTGPTWIEVNERQTATVDGRFDSLRHVIEELCDRGAVDLVVYGAADRPVTARYVERPLDEVLARLLNEESFVMGTRSSGEDAPRIAWLRVLGSEGGLGSGEARGTNSTRPTRRVSSRQLQEFIPEVGLTDPEPIKRREAVQAVARQILTNREVTDRFLAIDNRQFVDALKGERFGEEFIVRLRASQRNKDVREKLDAIRKALQEAK